MLFNVTRLLHPEITPNTNLVLQASSLTWDLSFCCAASLLCGRASGSLCLSVTTCLLSWWKTFASGLRGGGAIEERVDVSDHQPYACEPMRSGARITRGSWPHLSPYRGSFMLAPGGRSS